MPCYDGHAIVAGNTRLASAAKQSNKPDASSGGGVRVTDAYLGEAGNVRVANRHIIITNLLKSMKFEAKINCFDINLPAQLLLLAVGRVVYLVNLETNILKADMGTYRLQNPICVQL